MTKRRGLWFIGAFSVIVLLAVLAVRPGVPATTVRMPARLNDFEFWRLIQEFSEPNGYFRSDNLLSNELRYQEVIPELVGRSAGRGVYLGVGPEQNFTYIAALRPVMAFVPDIRRGNLDLQLLYKALFELSADRAEFVSRLFGRNRATGLGPASTIQEILLAYAGAAPMGDLEYAAALGAVDELLQVTHHFPLSSDDLTGIDYAYSNFRRFGPAITYDSSTGSRSRLRNSPSYADLMTAADRNGANHSYLANEENFRFVKDLEARNLIVPVVGDVAGPKAVREIGQYLKAHQGVVTAFYVSNVEEYLSADAWSSFCRNVATLPIQPRAQFVRSRGSFGRGLVSALGAVQSDIRDCDGMLR